MERVMSELANYFSKQHEVEVHIVLYGLKRDIFYSLSNKTIIHKPSFEFDNAKRLWHTFKTLWFLRVKVQEIQPDAILSFGELWNSFALLACKGLPFPVYISDRCQPDKPLGQMHERLRNWLYPSAVGIIVQTEMAKEIYSRKFPLSNIQVIGNPIRNIPPNPAIKKQNIVLSVGRLIESKHYDELIKIFADINPESWKLVIVGDDALKQKNKVKLQQIIDDLGMNHKIELAGKRRNVEDYYNAAKIFAFTSSSEGFPNVIGEAMSASLPVVAYDCVAGPSDLIEDGDSGFLVELHNTKAFKDALERLMNDKKLRETMGRRGHELIRQFEVNDIGYKFYKLMMGEDYPN